MEGGAVERRERLQEVVFYKGKGLQEKRGPDGRRGWRGGCRRRKGLRRRIWGGGGTGGEEEVGEVGSVTGRKGLKEGRTAMTH